MFDFFTLLEDIMKLLKLEMWNQGHSSLKQLLFEVNLNDEIKVLVRLVQIDDKYYYYLNVSKVTQESVLRERANQMEFMTQLISSLGHELNTPITEITKQIEMYLKKMKTAEERKNNQQAATRESETDQFVVNNLSIPSERPITVERFYLEEPAFESGDRMLESVHQTCMRLSYLISSMLSYSQILNGRELSTSTSEVIVRSVLEEVAHMFALKAERKGLSIYVICDRRIKVETDRRRLVGCLSLFVDNSIKFSNTQGEKIFLTAEVSSNHTMVVFKVVDFGNGINKRDMELITKIMSNPFMAAVTSSSAGLGIGLRMAECIISELSGNSGKSLEIQSKLQHGTTISFELPLKEVVGDLTPQAIDPNKLSVAGLLGLALLKPKLLQTKRTDASYQTERDRLLTKFSIEGNNSSERSDNPNKDLLKALRLDRIIEVAKSMEGMVFKQSNQFASSVVIPLGRGIINGSSRIQKKNSLTTNKMLTASRSSRMLTNIVITKPTKKVMIVDDEVFLLEFLRDVLEDRGLEVFTASGPERAFDLSALLGQMGKKIDMVYMDFNMPGMNGADCIKGLKSETYQASMDSARYTAVTAQDDQKVRDLFAQVGVFDFIPKPYSVDQVYLNLEKFDLLPTN